MKRTLVTAVVAAALLAVAPAAHASTETDKVELVCDSEGFLLIATVDAPSVIFGDSVRVDVVRDGIDLPSAPQTWTRSPLTYRVGSTAGGNGLLVLSVHDDAGALLFQSDLFVGASCPLPAVPAAAPTASTASVVAPALVRKTTISMVRQHRKHHRLRLRHHR
jgi:hypothetical protein